MNVHNDFLSTPPRLGFAPSHLRFPAAQTFPQAIVTRQSLPDLVEHSKESVVRVEALPHVRGSGFVVNPSGYILTNAHVVRGGGALRVHFENGKRFQPRLVHYDAERDIALLKIDSLLKFSALPLAQNVRDAEDAFALGYPDGLLNTFTTRRGIVSAQGHSGPVAWIQTDAAINPGDSGGPLLNERGEVIGMNTSGIRDLDRVNYAISCETLSVRLNEMILDEAISSISRLNIPSLNAFGPTNGSLPCNPIESAILNSHVDISNFVVESSFVTPADAGNSGWRAGFTFGDRSLPWQLLPSLSHGIHIDASGGWVHSSKSEREIEYAVCVASYSMSIKTDPDAINHLSVIVSGSTGWLFINGEYTAQLDISGRAVPGQAAIFATADRETLPTRFFDFRVRPLSMFQ